MSVFNLGSINADHLYRVPHLPAPGETLAATAHHTGLGGKGANQSVAAALAGSRVVHIGAVGPGARWALDRMAGFGVETDKIKVIDTPTGHAIINVDDAGENAIVIFAGANLKQSLTQVKQTLTGAQKGDILLLQNETNLQAEAARIAKSRGLFVIYSAAPFCAEATRELMPHVDLIVVNEVEANQLTEAFKLPLPDLPVPNILITYGAGGSTWRVQETGHEVHVPAFPVTPVDTTGAGDCFIGYTAAGLDQGMSHHDAMRLGAAAAALKVTRHGTSDAIPTRAKTDAFADGVL
ncbi:MAG: ribokinase [Rhodobacteraceae bacterium]|nr:ribokinase [Paracoccaceae bacterium]